MKTGPSKRGNTALKKQRRETSRDVFAHTIQKTEEWLNDVMADLEWENHPHKAYLALRTVLHALRDRLPVEEAIQLGAQLPMLVRGFYYEGWNLKNKPHKERRKEEFLDHVREAFRDDSPVNPQQIVRAVFRVLQRHTSPGEIDQVKHAMPKTMQELWS
jgi:uncharacterized protein (DUF2267 family)